MPNSEANRTLRRRLAELSTGMLLDRWCEPMTAWERSALWNELDARGYRTRSLDSPPPDVEGAAAERTALASLPSSPHLGCTTLVAASGIWASAGLSIILGLVAVGHVVRALRGVAPGTPDPRYAAPPSLAHAALASAVFAGLTLLQRRNVRWAAPAALGLATFDPELTVFIGGEFSGNFLIVGLFFALLTASVASLVRLMTR